MWERKCRLNVSSIPDADYPLSDDRCIQLGFKGVEDDVWCEAEDISSESECKGLHASAIYTE